jgi:hypothetical protein
VGVAQADKASAAKQMMASGPLRKMLMDLTELLVQLS